MVLKAINLLLYQILWFACLIGAGQGYPWLGVAVAVVVIAVQLAVTNDRRRDVTLIVASAVIGYVLDSALALTGMLRFPPHAQLAGPSPLWMVALWAGFATTLNGSLSLLRGRPIVAAVVGLVGGPLAYIAGEKLSAIEIGMPRGIALLAIAIEWAVALPILIQLNRAPVTLVPASEVAA